MDLNEVADWQGEIKRAAEVLTEALDTCQNARCGGPSDLGMQQICPECTKKLDVLLALVRRGPEA